MNLLSGLWTLWLQVDSGINSPASNDEELWKRVAHIGARAHQYDAANMPLNIPAPVPVSFVVLQNESSRFLYGSNWCWIKTQLQSNRNT